MARAVRLRRRRGVRGFTLVEVLLALAITALVAGAAYSGVSAAIDGVEAVQRSNERTRALNRTWQLLASDLRQFVDRPVRDELGTVQPALTGGVAALFPLQLTRTGWHNTAGISRSHLQRVVYFVEDGALWRGHYAVLDRAGGLEIERVRLLDDVESLELRFLASVDMAATGRGTRIDTGNWAPNWPPRGSGEGAVAPPAALEVRMELGDLGQLAQLFPLVPHG